MLAAIFSDHGGGDYRTAWRPKKPPLVQFGKRDEGEKNGDAMTREDIATGRALKMHDLALSVVRTKGAPKLDGSTTVLEYRYGLLTIHYRSGVGALYVWCVHKVLVVDRFAGKPQLIRYVPGAWQRVLVQAAAKVAGVTEHEGRQHQRHIRCDTRAGTVRAGFVAGANQGCSGADRQGDGFGIQGWKPDHPLSSQVRPP